MRKSEIIGYVGVALLTYAVVDFFLLHGLVERWQADGISNFQSWKTSVWMKWWTVNSYKVAAYVWSDSAANWISALAGIISLIMSFFRR